MSKKMNRALNWGIGVSLLLSALYILLAIAVDETFLAGIVFTAGFFVLRWSAKKADRFLKEHGYISEYIPGFGKDLLLKSLKASSKEDQYPDEAAALALGSIGISVAVTILVAGDLLF